MDMESATLEQFEQFVSNLWLFGMILLLVIGPLMIFVSMRIENRFAKALAMVVSLCFFFGGDVIFVNTVGFCLSEKESIEVVDEREELVESVPIVTLDGTSYISGRISGRSFMGTGRVSGEIHEDDYYTVMAADGNGGYKKRRYDVDCATILFDSSAEDARVEKVAFIKDHKGTATYLLFGRSYEFPLEVEEDYRYEYRIHVPEGSWGEYQFSVN